MISLRAVDERAVHSAFVEAFADYAMGSPQGISEDSLLLRMKKNAVDYDLSVGAYDEGRMVGFTLVGVDEWGGRLSAYDAGTGIAPAFRGQGLARRMFDHLVPALQERGVEQFVLEVLQGNEPAIKAYKKAGFGTTRELKSFAAPATAVAAQSTPPWELRLIDATTFASVARAVDWLPSFENRISAVRAIPDDVSLVGAYNAGTCIGAYAYSMPLRWLLSLVVARPYRRRGVGHALVAHAAAHVPEGVARIAALNVDGADAGMQQFFMRLGFTPYVDQYEMMRTIG